MIHINDKNKKSVQFCIFKVFCKHMFCKLKPFKGICLMSACCYKNILDVFSLTSVIINYVQTPKTFLTTDEQLAVFL